MARIDAPASHPVQVVLSLPVQPNPPYFLASRKQREGPFAFEPDAAFFFTVTPWELTSSRFEIATGPLPTTDRSRNLGWTAASLNFTLSVRSRHLGTGWSPPVRHSRKLRQCLGTRGSRRLADYFYRLELVGGSRSDCRERDNVRSILFSHGTWSLHFLQITIKNN